jgi:Flp pilus assembly pilin Flp
MNEFGPAPCRESGQAMAEYAVTLGVITLAVVATFALLSAGVIGTMSSVIASL